ncbi:hypothetical protein ABFT38_002488 [Salmonella enterica]|nr:hypothetical protein [Salmonella enterica]EHJ9402007.1 hypothetical protein [Salmonella enterica]
MSIKSIDVQTIAQICYVAVASQREEMGGQRGAPWEKVEKEQQDEITNYVCKVLTGQPTPETADGRMIASICRQFADPKKTLKYA